MYIDLPRLDFFLLRQCIQRVTSSPAKTDIFITSVSPALRRASHSSCISIPTASTAEERLILVKETKGHSSSARQFTKANYHYFSTIFYSFKEKQSRE